MSTNAASNNVTFGVLGYPLEELIGYEDIGLPIPHVFQGGEQQAAKAGAKRVRFLEPEAAEPEAKRARKAKKPPTPHGVNRRGQRFHLSNSHKRKPRQAAARGGSQPVVAQSTKEDEERQDQLRRLSAGADGVPPFVPAVVKDEKSSDDESSDEEGDNNTGVDWDFVNNVLAL